MIIERKDIEWITHDVIHVSFFDREGDGGFLIEHPETGRLLPFVISGFHSEDNVLYDVYKSKDFENDIPEIIALVPITENS